MRENRKDRSGYLPDILCQLLITKQLANITLPVHARIESNTRTGHRRWALRRYIRQAVTGKGRQHNGQMCEGGHRPDQQGTYRVIISAIRLYSTPTRIKTKHRQQDRPCPRTKFDFRGNPEASGSMRTRMFPWFKTIETHRQFIRTPFTDIRNKLYQTAEKHHIPETLRCRTQNGLRQIQLMRPSIHERGL